VSLLGYHEHAGVRTKSKTNFSHRCGAKTASADRSVGGESALSLVQRLWPWLIRPTRHVSRFLPLLDSLPTDVGCRLSAYHTKKSNQHVHSCRLLGRPQLYQIAHHGASSSARKKRARENCPNINTLTCGQSLMVQLNRKVR